MVGELGFSPSSLNSAYSETREVQAFEGDTVRILKERGILEAQEMLPGFSVSVRELFKIQRAEVTLCQRHLASPTRCRQVVDTCGVRLD